MYPKASKCLNEIKFNDFPKLEDNENNNIPYSNGAFITSPLIHYLRENGFYDSHASGDIDNFGILTKTIFGIPENRFIRILTIDSNKFKITWIVEDFDELLEDMMIKTDFDWRVFDKLGLTSKSKIIEFKFDFSDVIDESPDPSIVMSGIIDYNELKKNLNNA